MKRKILSALLCLSLALTLLPAPALAAEETATTLPQPVYNVITLAGDVNLTETYSINNGTNLTIDLNGHTITTPDSSAAIKVAHGGTLTITDGSENHSGKIQRTNGKEVYVVENNGTLNLVSGAIVSDAGGATALANRSSSGGKAVMHITGGKVTAEYIAIKNDCSDGKQTPELTIEGDAVLASGYDQVVQNWGKATIKGGTFSGCVGTWISSKEAGETTVTGGKFNLSDSKVRPTGTFGVYVYGDEITKAAKLTIQADKNNTPIIVDSTLDLGKLSEGQDKAPTRADVWMATVCADAAKDMDECNDNVEIKISAGTYSKPVPTFMLEDGYTTVTEGGKYIVAAVPKGDDGAKVEPTVDKETGVMTSITATPTGEYESVGKAEIPAGIVSAKELSQLKVTIKSFKKQSSESFVPSGAKVEAGIKNAIDGEGTKVVEVTIKKNGTEVYNTKDALNKPITITIGGLTNDTQYYLFCIMDDGTVTSYGYVTPTGDSISFTTTHLCKFGAAPVTNENKAALTAAVKADKGNHETTTITGGDTVTPAGVASTSTTYTRTDEALGTVTITGKKDYYYIIQATNAKNSAPGLIYCVQAGTDRTVTVRCSSSCVLSIWESKAVPNFSGGDVPMGLAEVKKQG